METTRIRKTGDVVDTDGTTGHCHRKAQYLWVDSAAKEGVRDGAAADGSSVAIEPHLAKPSEVEALVGDVIDASAIGLTTADLTARFAARLGR